jgi:uncharacterized protein
MNFSYNLEDIEFEWNTDKATSNLQRHDISFEVACEVFFDPFLKVEDAGIVEGEPREAVIGRTVDWKLLFVVYVVRAESVRIISARFATTTEKKSYEISRT